MGFVYYWLDTEAPVDRESRCTLEVEEELRNGLKEILEEYDVKIDRNEYIEQCICLFKRRAQLGEFRYRIGKSEYPTLTQRERQYIKEAHNLKDKYKFNNVYAETLRNHKDVLVWDYFTPPKMPKVNGNALNEIETLYLLVFDAVRDEFSFNKLNRSRTSKYACMTDEQKEEIRQIYQECKSRNKTFKKYNEAHLETYYCVDIIRKVLDEMGIDTSINHTNPAIAVLMCDVKTGEVLMSFSSKNLAAKYIYILGVSKTKLSYKRAIDHLSTKITEAIERKGTAFKYRWKENTEGDEENNL